MIRTCCMKEFYGRNADKGNKPYLSHLFHTNFSYKGLVSGEDCTEIYTHTGSDQGCSEGLSWEVAQASVLLLTQCRHTACCPSELGRLYPCGIQVPFSSSNRIPVRSLKNHWLPFMCFYLFPIKHCVQVRIL